MDLGQGYGEEVDLKISEDELREQILACQQEQIAAFFLQFDQTHLFNWRTAKDEQPEQTLACQQEIDSTGQANRSRPMLLRQRITQELM